MTYEELRNTMVQQLYTYVGRPVVMSDQMQPIAAYPFLYYQAVQAYMAGPYNILQVATIDPTKINKQRSEQATATFSFTACGIDRNGPNGEPIKGDDDALALAEKTMDFFLWAGRPALAKAGIVVVDVTNNQNRTGVNVDQVARRYGFDVLFRYNRIVDRVIGTVDQSKITVKEV